MPHTLYEPGTRKGNRFYSVRLFIDGRRYERTADRDLSKTEAKRWALALESELATQRPPQRGDRLTFAQAAQLYAAFRGLDLDHPETHRGPGGANARVEVGAINRLVALLGKRPVAELGQVDLVAAANELFPAHSAATKNRWAIKPGAAILHYVAEQKFCGWERIKKFKERRPQTRAVSTETAAALVAAAPHRGRKANSDARRLLLVWLFRHGTRISDTLRLTWDDNIELRRRAVKLRIGKTDEWTEKRLHAEVFELLATIPEAERTGPLFPWRTKSGVYRWLRPLVRELGVAFTPHMGRHSVGTWLNEEGAGLKTIMAALDHRDPASSLRYQAADIDVVAAATSRFAPLSGGRKAS